jgi:hypothetical protein
VVQAAAVAEVRAGPRRSSTRSTTAAANRACAGETSSRSRSTGPLHQTFVCGTLLPTPGIRPSAGSANGSQPVRKSTSRNHAMTVRSETLAPCSSGTRASRHLTRSSTFNATSSSVLVVARCSLTSLVVPIPIDPGAPRPSRTRARVTRSWCGSWTGSAARWSTSCRLSTSSAIDTSGFVRCTRASTPRPAAAGSSSTCSARWRSSSAI